MSKSGFSTRLCYGALAAALLLLVPNLPLSAQDEGEEAPAVQEESDAAAAALQDDAFEANDWGIEEIVVTARKREESLQDTPLSVSALGAEMIKDLGISATDDLASIAPNTYVFQPPGGAGSLVASMRGVTSAEPLLSVDSGVAIYLDDAYMARGAALAFEVADLERIEVLRGPQGTLYGRNATGGAIKFITRKPADEFGFQQDFGFGRYGLFTSRTLLETGEFGNGFHASLTYFRKERDGWIDDINAPDDKDPNALQNSTVRFALRYEPQEDFSLNYTFDRSDFDTVKDYFQVFGLSDGMRNALRNGGPRVPTLVSPTFLPIVPESNIDELWFASEFPEGPVAQNSGRSGDQQIQSARHEIGGHNLTLEYDLPSFTLRSITTFRTWKNWENDNDLDGNGGITTNNAYVLYYCHNGPDAAQYSAASNAALGGAINAFCTGAAAQGPAPSSVPIQTPVVDGNLFYAGNYREQEQWSQEFQVLGDLNDDVRYVLGAYFFEEEGEENNIQEFLAASPWLNGIGPESLRDFEVINFNRIAVTEGVFQGGPAEFFYETEAEAWAVFGNLSWRITEFIELTGGLRYSEDNKVLRLTSAPCGDATPSDTSDDANCPLGYLSDDASFDHFDYDATASWAVSDDANVYIRHATAYKSGGFNPRSQALGIDLSFNEEDLTSTEVGAKTQWLGGRVQLNLAAFHSQYENIQIQNFLAGSGGATSVTVNAGEADFQGVEVEALARLTEYVSLYLNYGYIDMQYKKFLVVDPGVALTVDPMSPQVPLRGQTGFRTPCADTRLPNCSRFGEGPIDIADSAPFSYRPRQTLSVGMQYDESFANGMQFSARIDVRVVEDIGTWTSTPGCWPSGAPASPFAAGDPNCGTSVAADAHLEEDGFSLVDVRLSLSNIAIGERSLLRLSLWGKNIFDEQYIRSGIDFAGLGFGGVSWGEPTVYGLDLSFEY